MKYTVLLLLLLVGCRNFDIGRYETSYLDNYLIRDPFAVDGNTSSKGEGLSGESHSIQLGWNLLSTDKLDFNFFTGPQVLVPQGGQYDGRAGETRHIRDVDDALTLGWDFELETVYRTRLNVNPYLSLGTGLHYTTRKWDGQGHRYLINFTGTVGLQFGHGWISEDSFIYIGYGFEHFSNGRGGVNKSNNGRDADIVELGFSITF